MSGASHRPRLSLVIPVLDEAATLAASLASLQAWRGQAEIILVDGGSEDQSRAIAEPLVDKVLRSAPGRATQMNAGAAAAQGEYLLFLHCDTRLSIAPAELYTLLDQSPGWGFFSVSLSGNDWRLRLIEFGMNWRSRLTAIATGDQCLFLSRECWEHEGGFAAIPLMEDVELCKRLRRHCRPFRIAVPVVTSSRRWEQYGILKTVFTMWTLRWRYWLGADPAELARAYYR